MPQTKQDIPWLWRALLLMAYDVVAILGSYLLALLLRFDFAWSQVPAQYWAGYRALMPGTVILVVGLLWVLRLYHSIWSFASIIELERTMLAWFVASALLLLFAQVAGIDMPASYWVVGTVLGFGATAGIRISYRLARVLRGRRSSGDDRNVLLVGAGESGRALIREIRMSPQLGMNVVAAIDDNPGKRGRYIEGVRVVGGRDQIAAACEDYKVEKIIFAIPSCDNATRKEILELCTATGLEVQAIPGMYQLVDGQVTVDKLRHVKLEDLLGREPIVVDAEEVRSAIEGKVVLVTGGGGSIGSELCRQVAKDNPKQLVTFDIYENNAYAIQQELRHDYPQLDLVTLIGSVRDERRLRSVFETYRPQLVFHAAAHCAIKSFASYVACECPERSAWAKSLSSIKQRREARPALDFLTPDEVRMVAGACDPDTFESRRDAMMVMLMFNTGFRVTELIELRASSFAFGDGSCRVTMVGKGRKERSVPLWSETSDAVSRYMDEAGIAADGYLFPGRNVCHLTRSGARSRLDAAFGRASRASPALARKRCTPHTLRHSTAMAMLAAGIDLSTIAIWLGHESISTTHKYMVADMEMKERALERVVGKNPFGDAPKSKRYVPEPSLLAFLETL